MKILKCLTFLLVIVCQIHGLEPYTVEGDSVKVDGKIRMNAAFPQHRVWLYDRYATIKVFDPLAKSFPGNNSQLVQILDDQGVSLAVQQIGGEPMFIRARVVPYFQTALLFIACEERRMAEKTEYIYKIEKDLTLVPFNVYISPEEAEKARPKADIDVKDGENEAEKKVPDKEAR